MFVLYYFRELGDVHIQFGRIEGMSTRKGEVIFLRDILDEAKSRMMKTLQEKESVWNLACFVSV